MGPSAGADTRPTPTATLVKMGVNCVRNTTKDHLMRGNPTLLKAAISNKYHANGTLKGASNQNHASRKRANFANVSVKIAVMQAKKEAKKKHERKLKKHKKHGKNGRDYDSSSSSSSDSDSSMD